MHVVHPVCEIVLSGSLTTEIQRLDATLADSKGRKKLFAEDILLLIRRDPIKFRRAVDLLEKWEEVKNVRKNDFEVE